MEKPTSAEYQTNSGREIYRLKGDSFDTMILPVRGLQDLAMRLYIAYLQNKNQPLFLDKTANAKMVATYSEQLDHSFLRESTEYKIETLLEKGKATFIRHDTEIDKTELNSQERKETNEIQN